MLHYLLRRLALSVPILALISTIVFFIMHVLPGDPVQAMLAGSPVSGNEIARLRQELGLNDPLTVQYARFAGHALRGDLG